MKYISFVVPCYNSEAYMENCIESLLIGGEDVEIIIIDDGSKDKTGKIADKYQKKYPKIVKAIHQENGGHGAGIMTGLSVATGKYFKVVDSDDWVDKKAYKTLLKKIKKIDSDLIIMNYVYTYTDGRINQTISFKNVFKENEEMTWDEMKKFKPTQYLSLHSLMYKKSVLDASSMDLPKHTFYEDNLFIYIPFVNTKTIYYMDLDFYRYFIGREDQSVNESVMISRIDQQLSVNKRMIDSFISENPQNINCRKYMINYLRIMMEVSSIFLIVSGTKEHLEKKKALWQYAKDKDEALYKKLRHSLLGWSVNIPTAAGRWVSKQGYKIANNIIGFN